MSTQLSVGDLDEPLRSAADDIGLGEVLRRLNPRRFEHTVGPHDFFCDECRSAITITESVGEAGHAADCSERETKYWGQTGRKGGGDA